MWINAGVSASAAGVTQSTFSIYTLADSDYTDSAGPENSPAPITVFMSETTTASDVLPAIRSQQFAGLCESQSGRLVFQRQLRGFACGHLGLPGRVMAVDVMSCQLRLEIENCTVLNPASIRLPDASPINACTRYFQSESAFLRAPRSASA